jgi:tRNA nucleotidyltransferase (CCA-adding enzyme)
MPDYMYLLESRLSPEQRAAVVRVQELARAQDSNVYLTGGAVRDLISGMPLRDLDFTVEGNPVRMVRELEKGGARIVSENERVRHYELVFAGDVDGSIAAARDEVYDRPGGKPEVRWSTVMEDLRRRDFSINAIAISLNPNSRGLLLDPTNGLADLEKHEVRALSIHAFTNQPVRLLRILRFCARMGFKMEGRTADWFELAIQRSLQETIEGSDVGDEVRQLGREDNPVAVLKSWESRGLLGLIHPHLARRRPDYDSLSRLARVRESMLAAGVRPRLFKPITYYLLGRLKPRERSATLHRLGWRAAEINAVLSLPAEAQKVLKMLRGSKTNSPRDAYFYIVQVPLDILAFLQVEFPNPRALSKIRNYLTKWRPLRLSLPVAELDSLGIPRGPKFDKILEDLFVLQLRGKGRNPLDRTKLLRRLAGIKEEPKKKPKEEKKKIKEKFRPAKVKGKPEEAAGHPAAPAGEKTEAPAAEARKPAVEAKPAVKEAKKAAVAPAARAKRTAHRPVHAAKKHKPAKRAHRR